MQEQQRRAESGVSLITKERTAQIEKHNWSLEHDRRCHPNGILADQAAALLLEQTETKSGRPLDHFGLVRKNYKTIRRLTVAGALVAAELDRLIAVTNEWTSGGDCAADPEGAPVPQSESPVPPIAESPAYRIDEAEGRSARVFVWDGDDVIAKFWKREYAELFVKALEADNARLVSELSAPVPSAPPVAESEGPRWKSILLGFEPYKFIARIDAHDGYLVTCSRGLAIGFIAETGWSGFGWVYLDSAQKYFSETTGTHAELHKLLYDTALSANQLPPHPRWEKPEGAEVFLGWCGYERQFDGWWQEGTVLLVSDDIGGSCITTCVYFDCEPHRCDAWGDAMNRARELRLPERAAAQKRVAAAEAELAAAKAALAEIGGGA